MGGTQPSIELMPTRAPTHKPLQHVAPVHNAGDDRYTASQRGYDSRWSKARQGWLAEHPLCVMCERDGRVTAADVVDHIVPHRLAWALASGDAERIREARALFWDRGNWQSLCKRHHDSAKQAQERAAGRGRQKSKGSRSKTGRLPVFSQSQVLKSGF